MESAVLIHGKTTHEHIDHAYVIIIIIMEKKTNR